MSASSNARTPSSLEPLIWQGLLHWRQLLGHELLPGTLTKAGSGRWEFKVEPRRLPGDLTREHQEMLRPRAPITGVPLWPAKGLQKLLYNALYAWVHEGMDNSLHEVAGLSLRYADRYPDGENKAGTDDWDTMSARLAEAYAVTLWVRFNTRDAWEYMRGDVQLAVETAGLLMVNERRSRPDVIEVDLIRAGSRKLGWVETMEESRALLERCLRSRGLEGASVDFVLREEPLPGCITDASTRHSDRWDNTLNRAFEDGKVLIAQITGGRPRDRDTGGEVADLVLALHKAAQTAPRGFVGLKKFTDILLPGRPRGDRERLVQAAIDNGVVRIGETPDGGSIAKTVALDPAHPLVQEILGQVDGALPPPIALPGTPLSQTVTAARAASAP